MGTLIKKFEGFKVKFTPIKLFSIIVILLGLMDHLADPTEVIGGNARTVIEIVVQGLFLFCGVFGLFGNGNTSKLRAMIVSFPLLYLASLYTIEAIESQLYFHITSAIILWSIGIWSAFFGDDYERRTNSFHPGDSSGSATEHST